MDTSASAGGAAGQPVEALFFTELSAKGHTVLLRIRGGILQVWLSLHEVWAPCASQSSEGLNLITPAQARELKPEAFALKS